MFSEVNRKYIIMFEKYKREIILIFFILAILALGVITGNMFTAGKQMHQIIKQKEEEIKELNIQIKDSKTRLSLKIDSMGIYEVIANKEVRNQQKLKTKINKIKYETITKVAHIDTLSIDSNIILFPSLARQYKNRQH